MPELILKTPQVGLEPTTNSLQLSQNYFWGWTISLPYP